MLVSRDRQGAYSRRMVKRPVVFAIVVVLLVVLQTQGQERFSFFQASTPESVGRLLELADLQDGDVVVDLGSGNGLIPLTAARMKRTPAGARRRYRCQAREGVERPSETRRPGRLSQLRASERVRRRPPRRNRRDDVVVSGADATVARLVRPTRTSRHADPQPERGRSAAGNQTRSVTMARQSTCGSSRRVWPATGSGI